VIEGSTGLICKVSEPAAFANSHELGHPRNSFRDVKCIERWEESGAIRSEQVRSKHLDGESETSSRLATMVS